MGREFELKYTAPDQALAAIRAAYAGDYQTFAMETTYYDTPALDFRARRWTFRQRMENGVPICTLKTPGGPHARGEWECRCARIQDSAEALCKLGCPAELKLLVQQKLVPICGARFTRNALLLVQPEFTAELALDRGILFAADRQIPLSEAELELKSGSEEALVRFARTFAGQFHLQEEPRSKFQRAAALNKGV